MLRIVFQHDMLKLKMDETMLGCSFSFLINATMLQKPAAAINDLIQLFQLTSHVISSPYTQHTLTHAHNGTN